MANAGITSSSWARGPFHEWGPHWVRGPARTGFENLAPGDKPQMQFASEFEWVAPSGRGLLTSFQANHYSAGWWMDAATTLEEAELEVHRLFTDLAALAATKNVLCRWTALATEQMADGDPPRLGSAYVWPKFLAAIPRESSRPFARSEGRRSIVDPADTRHEPDLHRQGRFVHRHQAGPRIAEHAPRRREVRLAGHAPRRTVPEPCGRQGGVSCCSSLATTGSPAPNRTGVPRSSAGGERRSSSGRRSRRSLATSPHGSTPRGRVTHRRVQPDGVAPD